MEEGGEEVEEGEEGEEVEGVEVEVLLWLECQACLSVEVGVVEVAQHPPVEGEEEVVPSEPAQPAGA